MPPLWARRTPTVGFGVRELPVVEGGVHQLDAGQTLRISEHKTMEEHVVEGHLEDPREERHRCRTGQLRAAW